MSISISKTVKFGQLCILYEKLQKAKGMFLYMKFIVILILFFLKDI